MLRYPYSQNLGLAATLAGFISQMKLPGFQRSMDLFVGDDLSGPVASSFPGAGSSYPPTYTGQVGDTTVILITCCQGLGQAIPLNNGYYLTGYSSFSTVNNPYLEQFPAYWGAGLAATHFQAFRKVVIAGHSLGGALAYVLADWFRRNTDAAEPFVLTYGACKPRDAALAQTFSGNFGTRWINTGDPVPDYPCQPTQWQQLGFGPLALQNAILTARFAQPGGGRLLYPDGSTQIWDFQESPNPQTPMSFAGWLLGLTQQGPHTIDEYARRLGIAARLDGSFGDGGEWEPDPGQGAGGGGDWGGPPEQPQNLAGPAVNRLDRAAAQTVFARGEAQQLVEPVIPTPQAFVAERVGDVWYVTFGGQQVAAAPTKRRARRMAREGNALIRSMLQQGVMDTNGFLQQMQGFFSAASDPTSGITPTMSTTVS